MLCSGGAVGEEVVVAAAGEVPLDPGAVGVVEHMPGEAAAVDDRVVALAEEGGVVEVGGSVIDPVDEVVAPALSKCVEFLGHGAGSKHLSI